jgi:death-on-curing protein
MSKPKEPRWLLPDVILAAHDRLIAEFGGSAGIRDAKLFESAMGRPHHLWNYEKPDLFDLAAAYAYGIVNNHAFVDGNKRSGFLAAWLFLADNDIDLTLDEVEVAKMTEGLADKSVKEKQYAQWLRECSQRAG